MLMFKNRVIQITKDGSNTITIPALNVSYHSRFGALQESKHIFIKEGLNYLLNADTFNKDEQINIFEVGFGTGLNALLSLTEAIQHNKKIFYQTIEPYQLTIEEAHKLNYSSMLNKNAEQYFLQLHVCTCGEEVLIHPLFLFEKLKVQLQDFSSNKKFHLIYFDAFDPVVQPELWTKEIFMKLFLMLYDKGILLTYSSKGLIRKAMQAAGFKVEKIPGPPGKREIVRAFKPG